MGIQNRIIKFFYFQLSFFGILVLAGFYPAFAEFNGLVVEALPLPDTFDKISTYFFFISSYANSTYLRKYPFFFTLEYIISVYEPYITTFAKVIATIVLVNYPYNIWPYSFNPMKTKVFLMDIKSKETNA
jgi:hypothetical protein